MAATWRKTTSTSSIAAADTKSEGHSQKTAQISEDIVEGQELYQHPRQPSDIAWKACELQSAH